MNTIQLTAADGHAFDALHAEPAAGTPRKGGVIVLQEIFGLDRFVAQDVERWAAAGWEAVAPALFDRSQRGFTAEHTPEGIAESLKHARAIGFDGPLADIAACRDALAAKGKVCVVGYCYGGSLTWIAAGRTPGLAAASSYYGSMVAANASLAPLCPTIVHLARKDAHIPADETRAAILAAQPQVQVFVYDEADHGFNNEDPARWHQESAELARRRTIELFETA